MCALGGTGRASKQATKYKQLSISKLSKLQLSQHLHMYISLDNKKLIKEMSKRHGTNRRWLSTTQKLDKLHPKVLHIMFSFWKGEVGVGCCLCCGGQNLRIIKIKKKKFFLISSSFNKGEKKSIFFKK